MKSKLLLWIGVTISILFYTIAVIFELEIFEGFCALMTLFEDYELDEVIIPLLILNFFLIIYMIQVGRDTSMDRKISDIHIGRLRELSISSEELTRLINKMHQLKENTVNNPHIDADWLAKLDHHIRDLAISANRLEAFREVEEREIKKILKRQ